MTNLKQLVTGFGLAKIKPEGMCASFEGGYFWDPRIKAKAKYIDSLSKYRQSSASKAWDKALEANAEAINNDQI